MKVAAWSSCWPWVLVIAPLNKMCYCYSYIDDLTEL